MVGRPVFWAMNGRFNRGFSKPFINFDFLDSWLLAYFQGYLQKLIPNIEIIPINIKKSNTNIFENTLHLDCCFQTIDHDKAIICSDGFKNSEDVDFLIKLFGRKNIFFANAQESYMLSSNVFVISPNVIVSDHKFKRLNLWLEEKGILVEKVDYSNVSKMSGLFRCSTLPLNRES